jgi:Fe-S-cluster-containing dehydrogenase component
MLTRRSLLKGAAAAAGVAVACPIHEAEARTAKTMPAEAVGLLYDGTQCIGCRACIAACKEANDMPAERTALAIGDYWDAPLDISGTTLNVIKAYRDGSGAHKDQIKDGFAFTKTSCMHCVDPSCVSACPVAAMTKNATTGIVSYDVDACIGCRYCVTACPFGVPRFTYASPTPKISKCQLCKDRLPKGKYAACAEVCPTGATLFGKVSELKAEITRRRALGPGTKTVFPRGKLGGADSYVGIVGSYVDHVYGEKEIGGTQVLHLSGIPFVLLDKPAMPDVAPASVAESLQEHIYQGMLAPFAFLGALGLLAWRHMREPEPGSEAAAGSEKKDPK